MTETPPLQFSLSWVDAEGDVPLRTVAEFSVSVNGRAVWPALGEREVKLQIYVDDLLSHLTEFWKPLLLRQTYPVRNAPDRPSRLRSVAEQRWAELPPAIAEREDERVSAFEEAHDLARAFSGLFGLPPLFLFRSTDKMIIDSAVDLSAVDFAVAKDALVNLGNRIAERLENVEPKWTRLITAWRSRDEGDPTGLLAWSTSLNPEIARSLVEDGTLEPPQSVSEAANDNNELRLAARMTSALPPSQIRQIISLVKEFRRHEAPDLDGLATATSSYIEVEHQGRTPHEQGEAAANFVRDWYDIALDQRIDIFGLTSSLGVELRSPAVQPETLDGLAIWGPRHGPGVLVNAASRRVVGRGDLINSGAARATVAHELCHLLLDGRHALSAVDILNSRMPIDIEKRARAFAAELLLPGRTAAGKWFALGQPEDLQGLGDCLSRLCDTYGVSRSLAAWKLEHGLHWHNIELTWQLDCLVPKR